MSSGPKLRALVVDDSAYNRRAISELLEGIDNVVVVGKAADGDEALRLVRELSPDVITLDLEMPRMDGFVFLRLLMASTPTPVVVVSGYAEKENVFKALELGALDFIAKPTRSITSNLSHIRTELAQKLEVVRHIARFGRPLTSVRVPSSATPASRSIHAPKNVIVIGASTGGPTALVDLFAQFPPDPASVVLVAQHMPPRFTETFAQRLDRVGGLRVRQADSRHALCAGDAWVCPGGFNMEIGADGQLVVVPAYEGCRYVPSVDHLFASAAKRFGDKVIAAVLTGMGDDGAKGVVAVKQHGGLVLAEAADTAVIFGMPQAAIATGCVDRILPLDVLGRTLSLRANVLTE